MGALHLSGPRLRDSRSSLRSLCKFSRRWLHPETFTGHVWEDGQAYLPLLCFLGTRMPSEPVTFLVEGVDGGSISMLAVQVG